MPVSLRWLAAAVALGAGACSPSAEGEDPCGSGSAAIYNGSPDPAPLELDAKQRMAIVGLETSSGTALCTGTLIAARWILTAAHCAQPAGVVARIGSQVFPSLRLVAHPMLDALLVELGAADFNALGATAITPWPTGIDADWIGLDATLAGYGMTEDGVMGQLFFAREPVVKIEPNEIWVDGTGRTGACAGDSGGPLLVADASGRTRIAGVLDRGSANCLGLDVYTRSDVLLEWIQTSTSGGAPACR